MVQYEKSTQLLLIFSNYKKKKINEKKYSNIRLYMFIDTNVRISLSNLLSSSIKYLATCILPLHRNNTTLPNKIFNSL